jgi:hypothetical protein
LSKRELDGLCLERVLTLVAGDAVSEAHSLLGLTDDLIGDLVGDLVGDLTGDTDRDDPVEARVRIGGALPLSRNNSGILSRECIPVVLEWWTFGELSKVGRPVT